MNLEDKIKAKTARICIIGLGYVGLPLAVGFAKRGYQVVGLDVDERKVAAIGRGESYIKDVASGEVASLVESGRLSASTDYDVLREVDVAFICVPTPFNEMKAPDLSFIVAAAEGIAPRLRAGQLVILQSTTYPGTTEEVVLPILERSGLKAGRDFHLAFSPERINPGDRLHTVENTPKVVGGLTPRCAELARSLLAQLTPQVHVVSSPRAAEMTKLLENIYRSVNIALVNELALLCERMGIDIWEVIEAASTKPFGFMPFYPGPGVGGHCLSPDEYIFLRDSDGGLKIVPIGDYFQSVCTAPDSRLIQTHGVTLVAPANTELLVFDPAQGRAVFKPLRYVSARPYEGPMVKIVTVDGRELTVTDGHPIITLEERDFVVKRADKLKPGHALVIIKDLPCDPMPLSVDLIAELPENEYKGGRVKPSQESFSTYRAQLKPYLKKHLKYYWDVFRYNTMPLMTYIALEREGAMPIPHQDVLLCTGRGSSYSSMQSQDHGGFATVQVREVTPVSSVPIVYSLETDDPHTFVTSYGFVVHNCIPVDPYYLSWKAREYDFYTKFIELAAEVNQDMPVHVVEKVVEGLNAQGKSLRGAKILILGVAFKPNVDDARNSPAQRVMELLLTRGAEVSYNDPYVPRFKVGRDVFYRREVVLESVDLTAERLSASDCVVIVAGHDCYDYEWIVRHAPLVVDTVNATKGVSGRDKVLRIGAPTRTTDLGNKRMGE